MKLNEIVGVISENTEDDQAINQIADALADPVKRGFQKANGKKIGLGPLGKLIPAEAFGHLGDALQGIRLILAGPSKDGEKGFLTLRSPISISLYDTDDMEDTTSSIVHELRHALDNFKSKGATFNPDRATRWQKAKGTRSSAPDYQSDFNEINARYVQAMRELRDYLKYDAELDSWTSQDTVDSIHDMFVYHHVVQMFTNGPDDDPLENKQYKRLVTRGSQFVNSEIEKLKKERGQ